MAWNDVYADDNAVHLLITVGGHKYNFSNGTDIKVERQIGDTLSKFSLGIIDDGTDGYIEFERIILNRFVNIEVEYGNSSKTLCKYTGFVVDYQPVFFGPTTKLTVTGYLTRKQTGVPDQSSPYKYYLDWTPLVGRRVYNNIDWDDIYNGNFNMDDTAYNKVNTNNNLSSKVTVDWIINQIDKDAQNYDRPDTAKLTSTIFSKITANKTVYAQFIEGIGAGYYSFEDKDGQMRYLKDVMPSRIVLGNIDTGEGDGITLYWGNAIKMNYTNYEGDEYWGTYQMVTYSEIASNESLQNVLGSAFEELQKYYGEYNKVDDVKDMFESLKQLNYVGATAKAYFDIGHVPYDYNLMKHYQGNIQLVEFKHPNDSKRSITRVVPDLFIEWDKDLPCSPEYVDSDGYALDKPKGSGDISVFPDWTINDIKMFGLKYTFNESVYKNNPGNPYAAFTLSEYDIHGIKRIYAAKDHYYIWVGDIPELYNNWKDSNWEYNNKTQYMDTSMYDDNKYYKDYKEGRSYKKGVTLKYYKNVLFTDNDKHGIGVANDDFTASNWDDDVAAGLIGSVKEWRGDNKPKELIGNMGVDFRKYPITALKDDDPLKGMKAISAEKRITQYLQAAYRSAFPISYGKVYISDIVQQLCVLEGWQNPKIVSTTASSYSADYLKMDGMSALEYISQKLCPNAMEAGGTGRVGFTCYFDSKGTFHFEPININGANKSTVLTMGYNINNSPVISFTVRSRGQILMLGVDESVDEINSITGETISVSTNRSELKMSETEARLNKELTPSYNVDFSKAPINDNEIASNKDTYTSIGKMIASDSNLQFFNLSMFNYFGYESNVYNYLYFMTRIYQKGVSENVPWGTSLIRRTYNSSSSSTTATTMRAIKDLDALRKTCIKAELTMIGDNKITPGNYILIENYTRKGNHYTSGKYYIQNITDNVSSNSGFTQTLTLWRYSESVYSMNNDPSTTFLKDYVSGSPLERGWEIYSSQGEQAFKKWYQDNFDDYDYIVNKREDIITIID